MSLFSSQKGALSLGEISHLARRAGFAASDAQINQLMLATSKQDAVQQLIAQPSSLLVLPEWHNALPNGKTNDPELRQQFTAQRRSMAQQLTYWWFNQMVDNSSPLQEKAVLFWANHFTSSLEKVKWAPAMLQQNLTLREHALGSFRDMLKAILRDPAMLRYLDNANSKKHSPNENLARELLELFTMGEGNYTEQDIKELARALTGASIDRKTGYYQFRRGIHDSGNKTIFAETAHFTPDDVADLILRQPQVAGFITDKLWRFFIDDTPNSESIQQLSESFVQSDFHIGQLLQELFLQDEFWAAKGTMIKSPMELLVGCIQLFNTKLPSQRQVMRVSRNMGQELFNPPHVKGWPEGKAWYTTANLSLREQVVSYFAKQAIKANVRPQLTQLLATEPVGSLPKPSSKNYLLSVLSNPAFQVV